MTQRLYTVTITYRALVLAEDEEQAKEQSEEIQRWDTPLVGAAPFDGTLPHGWDARCNVYTASKHDYTVAQAIAIHEGNK